MKRFSYSIFNEIGDSHISILEKEALKLDTLCSYIKDELTGKDHYHKEQVFSLFQTILFEVERLIKKHNLLSADTDTDHEIAVSFRKLIYENITSFLSMDEYCARLNINSKKLTEICKHYLYETPANVIRNIKILEAKRMLANHKITIQEVAYAIGFEQPTYFTKYFKKATGLTPKKFQTSIL